MRVLSILLAMAGLWAAACGTGGGLPMSGPSSSASVGLEASGGAAGALSDAPPPPPYCGDFPVVVYPSLSGGACTRNPAGPLCCVTFRARSQEPIGTWLTTMAPVVGDPIPTGPRTARLCGPAGTYIVVAATDAWACGTTQYSMPLR